MYSAGDVRARDRRIEELEEALREIIEIASTATLDWEQIGVRIIEMEAKARGALS